MMAFIVFEYDWIPGQRPNGLPGEDPVEIGDAPERGTELKVNSKNHYGTGIVSATRPDVGGITVLSIAMTECSNPQGFVDDLKIDGAVEVSFPELAPDD